MQSIIAILTQFNNYNIIIDTITTDAEEALVNPIKNNFNNTQRLSCLFHLKQDIILNAKAYGILNKNSKLFNLTETEDLITELCILPFKYKGNMEIFEEKKKN